MSTPNSKNTQNDENEQRDETKESNEDKQNFLKLTPKYDVDISKYREILKFALEQDDIINIGITGHYGSGKSSVINTFFNQNNSDEVKYNTINISLANFKNKFFSSNKDIESNNKILEQRIINQLLYQIDPKKIPLTSYNFVKKNYGRIKKVFIISGIICSFLFFFSHNFLFFHNSTIEKIVNFFSEAGFIIFISCVLYRAITRVCFQIF